MIQPGNEDNQIWIDAQKTSTYPIRVGKEKKFKVDWEGNMFATNGTFQGNIDADSGDIGAWHLISSKAEENAGALYTEKTWLYPDGKITVGGKDSDRNVSTPPENPPFTINSDGSIEITKVDGEEVKTVFIVDSNGDLTANNGRFNNATIEQGCIKIENLDTNGRLKTTFKVDENGNLFANMVDVSGGNIGSWRILRDDESFESDVIGADEKIINTTGTLYANKTYLFPEGRIRIGGLNNGGYKFEVDPQGNLYAKDATLNDGDIIINNGSIVINKTNKGDIVPVFTVDSNGNLTANDGIFNNATVQ